MSERMNAGGGEDEKMKRKLEEEEGHGETNGGEEHFLSLRISNNADMSKPLKVPPQPPPPVAAEGIIIRRSKEFGCKYCMKKFKSSQALGGHQNAHRRERVIWKMEREISTFGHHPHFCPCSSILPISRTTASSSSTFNNNPHFHHHHFLRHQIQPRPGSAFGMMMNTSGGSNVPDVEEKKPDLSSGLDLSLRL